MGSEEEVERIITVMSNPRQYKIPDWFLNRQKDVKDGRFGQMLSNQLDNKLREDLSSQEDPRSQGSPPLLGPACPWSAHQDDRPQRSHRWCRQQEINVMPSPL